MENGKWKILIPFWGTQMTQIEQMTADFSLFCENPFNLRQL
jgi:hypothetical protein